MANEFKIKKGLIVTGASGGTVVDIQGSQGQLFSVTDDLSGSIFAVSDISGVPILDVNSSGLSTFDGDVNLPDNKKILLGTGNDLEIYHDASHSYIKDIGVGDLKISSNTVRIESNAAENMIIAIANGGVSSYYNNVKKFETTSTGVNVTGGATITGTNTFLIESNSTAATFNLNSTVRGFDFINNNATLLSIDNDGNGTFADQAFATTATSSGDASSTLTTKGYVDGLITGATIYRGAWDPSGGGYGSPDLSGVTQTSGYYYICSAAGTAEPNGTGTEPDTWAVGDWVIYNDVSGTGQWQKIDNSSVLSGVGTGQTVALWEGANSVTDSETLGNAPITVNGNNSTFAGDVTLTNGQLTVTHDTNNVAKIIQSATSMSGTTYTFEVDSSSHSSNMSAAGAMAVDVYSGRALTIDGKGDIGIGTNAPATLLHVKGDADDNESVLFIENTYSSGGVFFPAALFKHTASNHSYGTVAEFRTEGTSTDRPSILFSNGHTSNNWSIGQGVTGANDNFGIGYRNFHPNTSGGWATSYLTINTSGNATFAGTVTSPTFLGDLNGTINTATTGTTQTAGDNSTLIATTAYADAAAAAVPIGNYLPLAGGTMTGVTQFNDHTNYGDQVYARFGASQDLQIFHNGTDSFIDNYTGSLTIRNRQDDGNIVFTCDDGSGGLASYLTLNGNSTHAYFTNPGNVGIGATSPGAKLDVNGDVLIKSGEYISWGTVGATSIEGSTASNKLQFRTNSSDRMIIDSTGRVGIGTTSPGAKLEVKSTTAIAYNPSTYNSGSILTLKSPNANTNYSSIRFSNSAGNYEKFIGSVQTGTNTADIVFQGFDRGAGIYKEYARIAENGNVGIGTSTPNAKLDVQGTQGQLFSVTDDLSGDIFSVADISGVPIMSVNSDGTSYFDGNVGIGTTDPGYRLEVDGGIGDGVKIKAGNAASKDSLLVSTNNDVSKFLVQGDGKVIINSSTGISGRTENFQVFGKQIITNTGTDGPVLYLGYNSSGSNTIQLGRGRTADGLSYMDFNGEVMSAGQFGFRIIRYSGQNASTELNHIGTGAFKLTCTNSADIILNPNSGSVGISQTNPSHKLDVTGDGRFTSTVTATNFILSSDERLKENVEKVCDNRVEADWKTFELKTEKGQKRYGVIAQELEKTNPEFVREDSQGFKSVAYIDLLIAKIAELEARLEKLEK